MWLTHMIDSSFIITQFLIDGFSKPYRRDRNRNGGILIYVREDIPSEELNFRCTPHDIEGTFIEINLEKD